MVSINLVKRLVPIPFKLGVMVGVMVGASTPRKMQSKWLDKPNHKVSTKGSYYCSIVCIYMNISLREIRREGAK